MADEMIGDRALRGSVDFVTWATQNRLIPSDSESLSGDRRWQSYAHALSAYTRAMRDEYDEQLAKATKDKAPRERAESWIRFIAEKRPFWGDLESFAYLVSRGLCDSKLIDELETDFEGAAQEEIEKCRADDADPSPAVMPYFFLNDFWGCRDEQSVSIDATMFRAVEWCEIGGFDAWWERKALEIRNEFSRGGISNQIAASAAAFNFCRSRLGIRLLEDVMTLILRCVATPQNSIHSFNVDPWVEVVSPSQEEGRHHVLHASNILFAAHQLNRQDLVTHCVGRALSFLLSSQVDSGPWPSIDGEPSPLVTANVIHSLAMWQPMGWTRAARRAVKWLWEQQSEFGFWHDPVAPDDAYLTVLVLDAIDLAEGRSPLTFVPRSNNDKSQSRTMGVTETARLENPPSEEIPILSTRKYLILQALLLLDATSADKRCTTAKIAMKAEGRAANPNQFKVPIAGLKQTRLVDTKEGRDGGTWLTSQGRVIAEKLCAQFPNSLETDSQSCQE